MIHGTCVAALLNFFGKAGIGLFIPWGQGVRLLRRVLKSLFLLVLVRKAFLPISGFKFVQTKFAKLLRMAIALLEIPVSGWTCLEKLVWKALPAGAWSSRQHTTPIIFYVC